MNPKKTAKEILRTATALALTLGASNALAETREHEEQIQCVPIYHGSSISIAELCDASKVNKQLKLKLDEAGCAIEQSIETEDDEYYGGWVRAQANYYPYSTDQVKLPSCTLDQVVSYEQEL